MAFAVLEGTYTFPDLWRLDLTCWPPCSPLAEPCLTASPLHCLSIFLNKIRGKRKDLDNLVEIVRKKPTVSFESLLDEVGAAALARYPKFVDKLKNTFERGRTFAEGEKPSVVLLIGESGSGKSWYARRHYPNAYRWALGNGGNSLWMDNYEGQPECVIDDYNGQIPFRTLLNLIDYHPYSMQYKGGTCQVHVKTWIITSNLEPEDWYPAERISQTLEPLERRLKEWSSRPNYLKEFKKWRAEQLKKPAEDDGHQSQSTDSELILLKPQSKASAAAAFFPNPRAKPAYTGDDDLSFE